MRSAKGIVAGGVAMAILMTAIVALQVVRERRYAETEPAQQILYVNSPAVLTRLALSYDAIVADLYWIRAIQHYGGTRLSNRPDKSYDLLYPLLDLTTSLDPNFSIAYRFGAFFLSEKKPGGAGRPDLAIRLLSKAMAARPDRWEFPHDIGFVHYRDGDYSQAAEWFERAAETPGAKKKANAPTSGCARSRPTRGRPAATRGRRESSTSSCSKSDAAWLRADATRRLEEARCHRPDRRARTTDAAYARRFGDARLQVGGHGARRPSAREPTRSGGSSVRAQSVVG